MALRGTRGIIYLILNKQNGHKYVGNTTLGMNKQWVYHIERSKRMSAEPLHKAFREFGTHNFMIKEIDECDETEFENKTNYWIEQYTPEYNEIKQIKEEKIIEPKQPIIVKERKYSHLIPLNEHTRGNGKHSGIKIRGKNLSTGLCTDYDNARVAAEQVTGNPINNANILLAARKGRTAYGHKWQLLEDKQKKKAVFGVNKRTEQIEVRFDSIADAARSFGVSEKSTGIIKSLRNPGRFSWKGYYWFYVR